MPFRVKLRTIVVRPLRPTLRTLIRTDAGWFSTQVIVVPSVAWLRRRRAVRRCETAKRRGVMRTRVIRSFLAGAFARLAAATAFADRATVRAEGACWTSGWPGATVNQPERSPP